jgi:hypothetical protein
MSGPVRADAVLGLPVYLMRRVVLCLGRARMLASVHGAAARQRGLHQIEPLVMLAELADRGAGLLRDPGAG